jgi:hypothetical protein
MNLTISPAEARGFYHARLEDGRELGILKTPFLSAARVLLSEGVSPLEPLTMTHAGSDMVCLRSTVGVAAALSLEESPTRGFRLYAYKPSPFSHPE